MPVLLSLSRPIASSPLFSAADIETFAFGSELSRVILLFSTLTFMLFSPNPNCSSSRITSSTAFRSPALAYSFVGSSMTLVSEPSVTLNLLFRPVSVIPELRSLLNMSL